jgi:heme exporter protein D
MFPWLIFAVVAVPLVVIAFMSVRRRDAVGEHPATEDAATRERTEREFAEAEAYEEQWREENKDHPRERMP